MRRMALLVACALFVSGCLDSIIPPPKGHVPADMSAGAGGGGGSTTDDGGGAGGGGVDGGP